MRQVKTILREMEDKKKIIGKARDELRVLVEELNDLYTCIDEGLEEISAGIDTISEKV